MALSLQKQTDFGLPATYHRITKIRLREDKKVDVELCGYVSRDARLAGNIPLTASFVEGLECGTLASLYEQVKETPTFSDAEDV